MKLRRLFETYSLWAFLVALILVLAVRTKFQFVRPENAANIMSQMSVQMIIALGMTMVIITAGIDLSVGSLVALTGVLGTMALTVVGGMPVWLAFLVAILTSIVVARPAAASPVS